MLIEKKYLTLFLIIVASLTLLKLFKDYIRGCGCNSEHFAGDVDAQQNNETDTSQVQAAEPVEKETPKEPEPANMDDTASNISNALQQSGKIQWDKINPLVKMKMINDNLNKLNTDIRSSKKELETKLESTKDNIKEIVTKKVVIPKKFSELEIEKLNSSNISGNEVEFKSAKAAEMSVDNLVIGKSLKLGEGVKLPLGKNLKMDKIEAANLNASNISGNEVQFTNAKGTQLEAQDLKVTGSLSLGEKVKLPMPKEYSGNKITVGDLEVTGSVKLPKGTIPEVKSIKGDKVVAGPPGPRGPAGPAGPAGPPGPAGGSSEGGVGGVIDSLVLKRDNTYIKVPRYSSGKPKNKIYARVTGVKDARDAVSCREACKDTSYTKKYKSGRTKKYPNNACTFYSNKGNENCECYSVRMRPELFQKNFNATTFVKL